MASDAILIQIKPIEQIDGLSVDGNRQEPPIDKGPDFMRIGPPLRKPR